MLSNVVFSSNVSEQKMPCIYVFDQCKRKITVNQNIELHVDNLYIDPANYKLNKNYTEMTIKPNEVCLIVLNDAKIPQIVWKNDRFEIQNSNAYTNLAVYLIENTMSNSSVVLPHGCPLNALFTSNTKIKNVLGFVNFNDLLPLFSKQ